MGAWALPRGTGKFAAVTQYTELCQDFCPPEGGINRATIANVGLVSTDWSEVRGLAVGPLVGLGPRGINRRLDFTFGRLPSVQIMYMGHARASVRA